MHLEHLLVPLWAASAIGSPIWTSHDGSGLGICDKEVVAAIKATEAHPEDFCKALLGAGSEIADACKCILGESNATALVKRATVTSTLKTSSSTKKASTSTSKVSSTSKKPSTSTTKATSTSSVRKTSAVSSKKVSSSTSKVIPSASSKPPSTTASVKTGSSTSSSQKISAASSKSVQSVKSVPTSAASNAAGTIATSAISSIQKAIQTASFTTISGSTTVSPTASSSSASPTAQSPSLSSTSASGSGSASSAASASMTSESLSISSTAESISATPSATPIQTTNGINQEILINGGFDDGDIVPWVGAITSNVGLEVTDGLYTTGEALFEHNFVQVNRRSTTLLSQDVTMYTNDTFRFSSRIIFNYGNGFPEGVSCDAAWFINQDYYQMTNFNSTNSGAYYDFAVEGLTKSSGSATVNIYMACTSTIRSMDFPVAIDDISLISNWVDTRPVAYTNDSPDARWTQFFNGSGVTQNLLTTGDAASTSLILRVGDASAAIQACAEKTSNTNNKAFDVHYSTSMEKWVCTQFPMAWQSTSLFNNKTEDATVSYGYFLHSENPQNW